MPSLKAAKSTERPNMTLTLQTDASDDRAAVAGAAGGQKSPGRSPKEPEDSDDDGKPPTKQVEDPEVSEEAGGVGEDVPYTQEDHESFDADDCGAQKLRKLCEMKNSLAREMYLRDVQKSELEIAREFNRMQKGVPPLTGDSGNPQAQKVLDMFPSPYLLTCMAGENRLHVVTQIKRYSNEQDEKGSMANHLVAYVGEINIASGLPQLIGLQSTEREKELFSKQSYAKQHMMDSDEADDFLTDEVNLGKFHTSSVKASRSNKTKRSGYFDTALMMRVPGTYAATFSDSPLLSVAYLRAKHIIKGALEQEGLSEEEQNLVDPLLDFITTAAHSRDGTHSVLAADWVAVEDPLVSEWMEAQMSVRLSNQKQQTPADSGKNKKNKKPSPAPKQPKKQRKSGGLFSPGGGLQIPSAGNQTTGGNNTNVLNAADMGLGLNAVTLPMLNQLITNVNQMTQLTQTQQANVQALQSQGVATTASTKLTTRDKMTLQAAAGIEDVADFALSAVYTARNGEEGKNDKKFQRGLISIFAGRNGLHVTKDFAQDLREVNLCENGSMLVETMHKGLTVFAVLYKEAQQIQKEDSKQRKYDAASFHTMDDREKLDLQLQLMLPVNYDGVKKALKNYECALAKSIGGRCPHLRWVRKLIAAFKQKKAAIEPIIDIRKALIILWAVHVDSRNFFHACMQWSDGDDLPTSNLAITVSNLLDERIQKKDTMPMEAILMKYGPASMQSDDEPETPLVRGPGAKTKTRVNKKVPEAFKPVLKKLKTKNKDVCFAMLNALGVQGCDFKGLKVGPKGTCIDFAVFGTCPNYKICNYQHNDVDPNANVADRIVKNLEKGLAAMSVS